MLIRKGLRVHFIMEDEKTRVAAPRGASMLHDPQGTAWGKCSLLFVSFRPGGPKLDEDKVPDDARHYLGKNHEPRVGHVDLPPRGLSSWEKVGRVTSIFYERTGTKARGLFRHPFGVRTALMLWRKGTLPTLYKRDGAMRLELGPSCIVDDRGIVFP
jgi:hypothetical protein